MDRGLIHSQISESFAFWHNMRIVSKSQRDISPEYLPSFLQANALLLQRIIELNNKSRICLIVPNRKDYAFWLSFMLAFPLLRKHFDPSLANAYQYKKGEFCLYKNQAIVQITNMDNSHINFKVNVNKRNGKPGKQNPVEVSKLCKDRIHFQPIIGEHTLSEYDEIKFLSKTQKKLLLDELLDVDSFGNTVCLNSKLLLLSSKISTIESINKYYVNDKALTTLFDWYYITQRKTVPIGKSVYKKFGPTIYVTSKHSSALTVLENTGQAIRLVIVDGASRITKELSALDEMMRFNIPIICITDAMDADELDFLHKREFDFIQWPREELEQFISASSLPSFSFINNSLLRQISKKYEIIPCSHSHLEYFYSQYSLLKKVAATLDKDHPLINILIKLSVILKSLTQLMHIPNDIYFFDLSNQVEQIKIQMKSQLHMFTKELEKSINDILNYLMGFLKEKKIHIDNGKIHCFQSKIATISEQTICVVTAIDGEIVRNYYQNIVQKHIDYITYDQFEKKYFENVYDQLWIFGFVNKKKLRSLMYHSLSLKISLFLYPFEQKFFRYSVEKWWQKYFEKAAFPSSDEFINHLLQSKHTINLPQETGFTKTIHGKSDKRKIVPNSNIDNSLIRFAGDYSLICSPSHHLYMVTDFVNLNYTNSIPKYLVSNLHIGDYLLFRMTGADIIREWVDRDLLNNGEFFLRQLSEIWKKPLQEFVEKKQNDGYSLKRIYQYFYKKGMKISIVAFISWLDSARIGPQRKEHLKLLAEITVNNELEEKLETVDDAIKKVRAKHRKAWIEINRTLSQDLFSHISEFKKQYPDKKIIGPFNVPRVGEVIILRINNIEIFKDPVNPFQLNRLVAPSNITEKTNQKARSDLINLFYLEDQLCNKLNSILATISKL